MSLSFKTNFSPKELVALRVQFKISEKEEISGALWLKSKRGFVFTDRRFYWNVPTEIQKDGGKTLVNLPSNILQKNISQLGTEKILQKNAEGQALVLSSSIGDIRFDLGKLEKEESAILADFFTSYVRDGKMPLQRASGDSFLKNLQNALQKNVKLEQEFLRSIIDIAAGCFLNILILFSLKPVLLIKVAPKWSSAFMRFLGKLGNIFFVLEKKLPLDSISVEIQEPLVSQLVRARNAIFVLLLLCYILLKIVFLILSKNKKIVIPLLSLVLEVASLFLLPRIFPLFLILTFCAYFTFQWKSKTKIPVALLKLSYVFLCTLILIYELHLFLYPGFANLMSAVVAALSIPLH